ncbi:hypothetical protein ZYGR_0AG06850 [Zygosaccharomyces rouxii]|uniref:Uncharacterized protein n=1 Tax=Zygosaccharomyces rouxii TaxID=4956 RepID=A0A1Q3AAC7_ZYGRO|nr:hypothetical protein ZYGR_0AG06850 [Zygosaccharomyces rouxii]
MRCTYSLRASLSSTVFTTKKSFERQLDTSPTTAFHYYCQLQHDSKINNELQWKKFMRREWELLSLTRKRLYYAFYFHFKGIDYKSLNNFELAKFLEIPTPAASEYMMFRNIFKFKFDNAWLDNLKKLNDLNHKGRLVKKSPITGGHRLTVFIPLNQDQLQSEATNYTKRYQQMCRECRRVWNEKVTMEQKLIIREKWEQEKQVFNENIRDELDALKINLNRLNQLGLRHEYLLFEENSGESTKKK